MEQQHEQAIVDALNSLEFLHKTAIEDFEALLQTKPMETQRKIADTAFSLGAAASSTGKDNEPL